MAFSRFDNMYPMPGARQGLGGMGSRVSPLLGGPGMQIAVNSPQVGPTPPPVPQQPPDETGANLRSSMGMLAMLAGKGTPDMTAIDTAMENVNATMDSVNSTFDLPGEEYFTRIASAPPNANAGPTLTPETAASMGALSVNAPNLPSFGQEQGMQNYQIPPGMLAMFARQGLL